MGGQVSWTTNNPSAYMSTAVAQQQQQWPQPQMYTTVPHPAAPPRGNYPPVAQLPPQNVAMPLAVSMQQPPISPRYVGAPPAKYSHPRPPPRATANSMSGNKRPAQHAAAADRPVSKKQQKRLVAAAPLVTGPVVIREPKSEEERRDVEAWKEERRKHYPTAANLQRKQEEQDRIDAQGGLDPRSRQRQAALKAILERQRDLGLARAAGTEDLSLDGSGDGGGEGWSPRGWGRGRGRGWGRFDGGGRGRGRFDGRGRGRGGRGGRGGRFPSRGGYQGGVYYSNDGHDRGDHQASSEALQGAAGAASHDNQDMDAAATADVAAHDGAGWRNESPGFSGRGRGSWGRHHELLRGRDRGRGGSYHQYAAQHGTGGQHPGMRGRGSMGPRPRGPSLLEKLLANDIRKEASWLLQAIRFVVVNNFLQPQQHTSPSHATGSPAGMGATDAAVDGVSQSSPPTPSSKPKWIFPAEVLAERQTLEEQLRAAAAAEARHGGSDLEDEGVGFKDGPSQGGLNGTTGALLAQPTAMMNAEGAGAANAGLAGRNERQVEEPTGTLEMRQGLQPCQNGAVLDADNAAAAGVVTSHDSDDITDGNDESNAASDDEHDATGVLNDGDHNEGTDSDQNC